MFTEMNPQWLTLGSAAYNQQFGQAGGYTGNVDADGNPLTYQPPKGQFQIMPDVISNMIQQAGGIGDSGGGKVDKDGMPVIGLDENGGQVTPQDLLNQKMQELGISQAVSADGKSWAYIDKNGVPIPGTINQGADAATGFWNAALLAGGVAGGAAAGAFGGAGAAGTSTLGGAGEAVGGELGSLGSVGSVAPISTAGLTAPALGSLGGAAGALGISGTYGSLGSLGADVGTGLGGASGALTSAVGGGGGSVGSSLIPGISNGSLLNFGGSLASGLLGSSAANNAAAAQLAAGRDAVALGKYEYDTTRADNLPALTARNSALTQIQALLSNPGSITSQPSYQFGLDQGTKTLNNGAAARGMTYSGQQGKALTQFGNDYAGTKLNDSISRLATLGGLSQPGASTIAASGANYANNGANLLTQMGNARGSGYVGSANAWGNAFGGALNNYNQDALLNRLGYPGG